MKLGIYKHYKGNLYLAVGTARFAGNGEHEGDAMVLYYSLYTRPGMNAQLPAQMQVRSLREWNEMVDWGAGLWPRFRYLEQVITQEK